MIDPKSFQFLLWVLGIDGNEKKELISELSRALSVLTHEEKEVIEAISPSKEKTIAEATMILNQKRSPGRLYTMSDVWMIASRAHRKLERHNIVEKARALIGMDKVPV